MRRQEWGALLLLPVPYPAPGPDAVQARRSGRTGLRSAPSNGRPIRRERGAAAGDAARVRLLKSFPIPARGPQRRQNEKILSKSCENPGRALASCPRFRVEGGP